MADVSFPKPSAAEASEKISKVVTAVNGDIATFNGAGDIVDSGYTIAKSVPSNALFTDTTYGVVSKSAAGLCPTLPNETNTTKYLRQDGSWITPPNDNTTYSFSNNAPTLAWNTTSTIGTVGGTALTVKLPANPNTNTTYSFTNNAPTLAWNTTSTVGVCGGVALTVKLPANPNTDHYAWSDITGKPDTATRWPSWSEVTGKPNRAGSQSDGGSANSAVKLDGFNAAASSQTWGNQTGTFIHGENDSTGGSIAFRQDNPSGGQCSFIIDGTVYIKEGGVNVGDAVKTITRSGTTFTVTTLWGNTWTFTQQDNDHYAWSDITGKPDTATRWPSWSEVTGKPNRAGSQSDGGDADNSVLLGTYFYHRRVIAIPSASSYAAGWRRVCKVTPRANYMAFFMSPHGGYNNIAPTAALVRAQTRHNGAALTLLANYGTNVQIRRIRLVSISGNSFWVDVYMNASSLTNSDQFLHFYGNVAISDIQNSSAVYTGSETAAAEISLETTDVTGIAVTNNNYSNWLPSKTGSGASGTWGISISGSATYAGSASDGTPTVDANYCTGSIQYKGIRISSSIRLVTLTWDINFKSSYSSNNVAIISSGCPVPISGGTVVVCSGTSAVLGNLGLVCVDAGKLRPWYCGTVSGHWIGSMSYLST